MKHLIPIAIPAILLSIASPALAEVQVSKYDDLPEGFLGTSYVYQGITYHDVNGVGGVFPDGSTFNAADTGDQLIIENAQFLFNDHPSWGSASNVLNFGTAFIPGGNLTLGALSRVTMDLPAASNSASIEMCFYENGPWGGIEFHLEALLNGSVVDASAFTILNEGGRDRIAFNTLSVAAPQFDSLRIFATYDGHYSAPRLIIDDLTISTIPSPASFLALAPLALARRQRRN